MFKKIIEDIQLARLSYLIEELKTKDLNTKFKIFKKLDKMKITTQMGLELLDATIYNFGIEDGNGGINSSLFSLCIKDYKSEYSPKILKLFPKYNDECKDKVLYLLSSIDNEDALKLYADIILKYYKDKKFIPISNLHERVNSYKILFPKLYKALKFNDYKNNLMILFNDYLNAGVVTDNDLLSNKRVLQTAISKIINDSFKFKFTNTSKGLQDEKYIETRLFLEIAINIEYYVSSVKSKNLIDKLFKGNDNQLKLFIIENYIRKQKDIKKVNLLPIAKDNASRYPLFELLSIYNLLDYFPKQYLKPEKLALSDLYINFVLINGYKELPKAFKFIKRIEIDGHLYYVFTFKYSYYENNSYDITTNYLIKEAGLDKYKNQKITSTLVGLSGGYNLKKEISLIETTNNKILWEIKKEKETIDSVIEKIKASLKIDKKENTDSIEEEKQEKKKGFRFSYILIFLFLILLLTVGAFIFFLQNPDLIRIDSNNKIELEKKKYLTSKIINKDKFKEINAKDIFTQPDGNYYVLFFKKKSEKNSYFTYINKLIENNYIIYYVDLSKDENKFLYNSNELNFTLTKERFLKVEEGDFSFYIDGKTNILDEFSKYVKELEEAKKEAEKQKKLEEKEKKKQEK